MNFKLTLVLVVILAALGITYYFYQKAPSTTADDANAKNLISPKPKAITKITWSRDGSPVYTLEKIAGKDDWQLTAPLTAAVESWSASSIADTLRDLQYKDKFTAEPTGDKSLEETGLDKPKQSVTFTADDKSHTLDLGKRTPAGDIFLRLDNGSLYKADNSFVTTLNKKVSDLRSKDLVKVTSDNVLAIKLIKPDQAISASKTAGKWTIDLPIATRGNATPLDDLVTGVTGLRADNFSSIKKTNPGTGLTPPAISVTLLGKPPITATSSTAPASQPAQASLVTVEFGGQADIAGKQIYASRSDTDEVFLVNADVLKKVDKSLADLRDPAITPVDLTPATQVSITYADPAKLAASMSRQPGGQWTLDSLAFHPPADGVAISEFLNAIKGLRANKYVDHAGDLKTIGLDPPQEKITITIPGQSQQETILIGKPETADFLTPIQRQGEPTVYLVQNGDTTKLAPTLLTLRDKVVLNVDRHNIQTITIGTTTLKQQADKWTVGTGPSAKPADTAKIDALLAELTPLQAREWETTKSPAGTPDVTLTIVSEQPAPATTTTAGPPVAHTTTQTIAFYHHASTPNYTAVLQSTDAASAWEFRPTDALITAVIQPQFTAPATQPSTQPAAVK